MAGLFLKDDDDKDCTHAVVSMEKEERLTERGKTVGVE